MPRIYFLLLQVHIVLSDEATTWSEKEAQMRVLLDAKGHKIEELQYAMSDLKESSERDIRIMKHQLLMVTGLHTSALLIGCRSCIK